MSRPTPDPRLAPCPFCGCGAFINEYAAVYEWSALCTECGAEGAIKDSEPRAIEAWNLRFDIATGSTEEATPLDHCTDTGDRHGCRCRACREREDAKREHREGRADYDRDTMVSDEMEGLR